MGRAIHVACGLLAIVTLQCIVELQCVAIRLEHRGAPQSRPSNSKNESGDASSTPLVDRSDAPSPSSSDEGNGSSAEALKSIDPVQIVREQEAKKKEGELKVSDMKPVDRAGTVAQLVRECPMGEVGEINGHETSVKVSPKVCSGHGECRQFDTEGLDNQCVCNPGWCGNDCSIDSEASAESMLFQIVSGRLSAKDNCCPRNCSDHGICVTGTATDNEESFMKCECLLTEPRQGGISCGKDYTKMAHQEVNIAPFVRSPSNMFDDAVPPAIAAQIENSKKEQKTMDASLSKVAEKRTKEYEHDKASLFPENKSASASSDSGRGLLGPKSSAEAHISKEPDQTPSLNKGPNALSKKTSGPGAGADTEDLETRASGPPSGPPGPSGSSPSSSESGGASDKPSSPSPSESGGAFENLDKASSSAAIDHANNDEDSLPQPAPKPQQPSLPSQASEQASASSEDVSGMSEKDALKRYMAGDGDFISGEDSSPSSGESSKPIASISPPVNSEATDQVKSAAANLRTVAQEAKKATHNLDAAKNDLKDKAASSKGGSGKGESQEVASEGTRAKSLTAEESRKLNYEENIQADSSSNASGETEKGNDKSGPASSGPTKSSKQHKREVLNKENETTTVTGLAHGHTARVTHVSHH